MALATDGQWHLIYLIRSLFWVDMLEEISNRLRCFYLAHCIKSDGCFNKLILEITIQ